MRKSDMDGIDVRSLRFLATLLDLGTITAAGSALGLSQTSASREIARLRKVLGDPLVVRGAHGPVLTGRALALVGPVADALAAVGVLFQPTTFEPLTAERLFRVASTDYGAICVLAAVSVQIARLAPQIRIEIVPWGKSTRDDLSNRTLDAALYIETDMPADTRFKPLFRDDYVLIHDPRHHTADKSGLSKLVFADRVVVLYPTPTGLMRDDPIAAEYPHARPPVLLTPYFAFVAPSLTGTSRIAVVPRRVATTFGSQGLTAVDLPFASAGFDFRLYWHERHHQDAGHKWFRSMMTISGLSANGPLPFT